MEKIQEISSFVINVERSVLKLRTFYAEDSAFMPPRYHLWSWNRPAASIWIPSLIRIE